jgi:aldehyde:ferredoxin oxidoreductase
MFTGLFGVMKSFPEAARLIKQAKSKQTKDVLRYTAGSFYMQLVNARGMCLFGAITSTLPIVDWMNAATGWDLSPDEYLKTGERILSLRKAFNMREGIQPTDQQLGDRAIGKRHLEKGPLKGKTIDIDNLMREFYDTVGWELATGGPTPDKLKALEID